MKYESLIKTEFAKLGYSPREIQLKVINETLEAFIEDGKRYAVINVSTGGGKSLIAFVIHCCLKKLLFEISENEEGFKKYELNELGENIMQLDEVSATSAIYMHTNSLIDQYAKSFTNKKPNNFTVKGAANYDCMLSIGESAESCCYRMLKKKNDKINEAKIKTCETLCHYKKTVKNFFMGGRDIIFSNYSIMLSYALSFPAPVCNKMLSVYDEAQLLNDTCASHLKITISSYYIDEDIKKLEDFQDISFKSERESLSLISYALKKEMIDKPNIPQLLKVLISLYSQIFAKYEKISELAFTLHFEDESKKLKKLGSYFQKKVTLLTEFFLIKYECELEISTELKKVRDGKKFKEIENFQIIIHPIFMKEFFNKFKNKFSNFYLFMSGTINKEFVMKTTGIKDEELIFIKSGPVFDVANKKLNFLNLDRYNQNSLKDNKVIDKAIDYIIKILNFNDKEKGIIQTPSFVISNTIFEKIKNRCKSHKIFIHTPGEPVTRQLELFKECKESAVFISPSLFEGIDLADELSRFQILFKAPYPSLGDARMKYILEHHKDFYQMITINKIIQSFGRSVRNEKDWSQIYCFDSMIFNLFNEPYNTWRDEFQVKKLNS